MRLPRVRFMVRQMMVAVVVVAVVTGATVILRRHRVYRVRAEFYAQEEQVAAKRWQHWSQEAVRLSDSPGDRNSPRSDQERQLAVEMVRYSRNRVAHHARLKVKYERVARCPWLPIDPDPPSPDGVTPPL
jgi:hypothetical protein